MFESSVGHFNLYDDGFEAASDALRQCAESGVDAFAFDESAAKAKREEFPELFAS